MIENMGVGIGFVKKMTLILPRAGAHLLRAPNTFISRPKYRMHLLAQTWVLCILQLILAHGTGGGPRREGILPRKEDIENETRITCAAVP